VDTLANSTETLAIVVSIFFFTSNLSGVFLPVYFRESGLTLLEIVEVLLFTFLVIGLLPITLMKIFRNFEAIFTAGIFATMLFNIVLIFVKDPIVLGLFYGLSMATFWPSFNLLQFRLSEMKVRARTMSALSVVIPGIASVIGPAVGSFIIIDFSFTALFSFSIVLYLVAFVVSLRIKFAVEIQKFKVPRGRIFQFFFATFVLWGFIESYWLPYPFFVLSVASTVLNMGLIYAISGLLIAVITFVVSWISDVKRMRIEFSIISALMYAAWYFAIANSSTMYQLVTFSIISGLASAFGLSWFVYYADVFPKENYASILVLMEVGLMMGRIANLAPTYALISINDYASYFMLLGVVSLFFIPFYAKSKQFNDKKKVWSTNAKA
jgi:MFS family permease